MSRSLNKAMLIGNVGNDPEIRSTAGGTRVAKLSLATNRTFQDRNGQKQDRVDWHRCTIFGKLVDVVEQYVQKGDRVFVEGRIEYSTSEDNGITRHWTDIIVDQLIMLGNAGGVKNEKPQQERAAKGYGSSVPLSEPDDDLPF